MYVQKIVERELYLTMTDTPGIFFLAEPCLWTVSFHKEGQSVCMDVAKMAVVALPIQYQVMHNLMPKQMLLIFAKENIGDLNF